DRGGLGRDQAPLRRAPRPARRRRVARVGEPVRALRARRAQRRGGPPPARLREGVRGHLQLRGLALQRPEAAPARKRRLPLAPRAGDPRRGRPRRGSDEPERRLRRLTGHASRRGVAPAAVWGGPNAPFPWTAAAFWKIPAAPAPGAGPGDDRWRAGAMSWLRR